MRPSVLDDSLKEPHHVSVTGTVTALLTVTMHMFYFIEFTKYFTLQEKNGSQSFNTFHVLC